MNYRCCDIDSDFVDPCGITYKIYRLWRIGQANVGGMAASTYAAETCAWCIVCTLSENPSSAIEFLLMHGQVVHARGSSHLDFCAD